MIVYVVVYFTEQGALPGQEGMYTGKHYHDHTRVKTAGPVYVKSLAPLFLTNSRSLNRNVDVRFFLFY